MIEHRLIEKMIAIIKEHVAQLKKGAAVDPLFIDTAVDFIRTYTDRTHHGKEEDILFRECAKKDMTADERQTMIELIADHRYGRKMVGELVKAKQDYVAGKDTLQVIITRLSDLVAFYPKHIQKEDKIFFPQSEKYFSEQELADLLEEFWAFDKQMIHEKYNQVVAGLLPKKK